MKQYTTIDPDEATSPGVQGGEDVNRLLGRCARSEKD